MAPPPTMPARREGDGKMVELDESQQLFVRPEYEILPVDASSVLVRSPGKGVRVGVKGMDAGELARALGFLDGSRRFGALREHGAGFVEIVRELVARDIVRLGCRDSLPADLHCFARTHDDPKACRARLNASRVGVCGTPDLADRVRRGLREVGAHPQEWRADGIDMVVACLGTPRDPLAESVSRESRAKKTPWLPLLVFGDAGFVGPLFLPDDGPCLTCLQSREAANWSDPELTSLYYDAIALNDRTPSASAALPAYGALVCHWGIIEATKFLAQFRAPALLGTMLRIDFARAQAEPHRVFRIPRCRSCSPGMRRPPVDGQLFAS